MKIIINKITAMRPRTISIHISSPHMPIPHPLSQKVYSIFRAFHRFLQQSFNIDPLLQILSDHKVRISMR